MLRQQVLRSSGTTSTAAATVGVRCVGQVVVAAVEGTAGGVIVQKGVVVVGEGAQKRLLAILGVGVAVKRKVFVRDVALRVDAAVQVAIVLGIRACTVHSRRLSLTEAGDSMVYSRRLRSTQ